MDSQVKLRLDFECLRQIKLSEGARFLVPEAQIKSNTMLQEK